MARWGVSGDPGGVDAAVSHRRLLPSSPYLLPLQDGALFERIGGQATIDRLVDSLYDRFQADAVIRPFFGGDLRNSRNRQKRFFSEWLGGAPRYSESAWGGLYQHHEDLRITPAVAERWLQHLSAALVDAVPDGDDAARILERAHAVARMLVNSDDEPQSSTGMPRHRSERAASCGVGARTVKQAGLLAQRGQVEELAALVAEIPKFARASPRPRGRRPGRRCRLLGARPSDRADAGSSRGLGRGRNQWRGFWGLGQNELHG